MPLLMIFNFWILIHDAIIIIIVNIIKTVINNNITANKVHFKKY